MVFVVFVFVILVVVGVVVIVGWLWLWSWLQWWDGKRVGSARVLGFGFMDIDSLMEDAVDGVVGVEEEVEFLGGVEDGGGTLR